MSPTRLEFSARHDEALTRFQLPESLEFGTVISLSIPTKLAKQPGSGKHRITVKSPVGVTVAGVPVFPAAADALEQDDVAMSLVQWRGTLTPGHTAPDKKVDGLRRLRHDH